MNEILDLPPILNDNPNYKNKIYFLFGFCALAILFKLQHWPGGNLLLVIAFGYLTGFSVVGIKNKFHPAHLFRLSLILCSVWLCWVLNGPLFFPNNALNPLGIAIYFFIAVIVFIALQVQYHLKKQRNNRSPD